ncbi:MAG: mannitol dehydrogenase family protein [Phenylobacterium sp.]|nr:MAG: mannitol dehydrogenase family protein [Phenylobacterium sp.]
MRRLSEATLGDLPADVERPGYDRAGLTRGVVHLGVGAFHRAHQAVVFDELIRRGDTRWGITGASLRSPAVREQLQPQDGLYTVLVRDAAGTRARVIGALSGVLVAPENPTALIEALAAPATEIVTLTVTEKGYLLDPASGALLADDPQVAADLVSLAAPQTAAGFLTAALRLRRDRGLAPFTAISCDNLPGNGARLRGAVLALAAAHDPRLADWIAERGAFPQTMVDRIVPATSEADIDAWARQSGREDRALVKTEPFSQWVIEDRFAGARPDFAAVGVQMTADVAPWEAAKLRLLNGAHSAIAYLGGLAGIDFVHEFVGLAEGRGFVERLWDEAAPTLTPPPGLDVPAYRAQLMARFANPALQHRTRQIAMDGSQKLPQRLLATIAARLDQGRPIAALALAVAAWMRWQRGRDEAGRAFAVDDPLASTTARLAAGARSPAETVAALVSLDAIFPPRLAADAAFREAVTRQLERLVRQGARGVLTAGA